MPPERPRLMMETDDENATRRFFVEALRANTSVMEGLRDEMREDRKLLHDIHTRVVKIESNRLDSVVAANATKIEQLDKRVDLLERDKDRRDGAMSGFDWMLKNWPGVIGFFALIAVILKSTGQI